jgi:hypothetical protein
MKTGDKVKVLDIHPEDGFYEWREEFIGSCGILSEDLVEQPEGYWSAGLEDGNWVGSPEIYFYKVKLKEIREV